MAVDREERASGGIKTAAAIANSSSLALPCQGEARTGGQPCAGGLERGAHEGHCEGGVASEEVCRDAHDSISGAAEVFVTEGIEGSASGVHAAVDFDDEVPGRADEIGGVAADDHLATEGDVETAAAQLDPQELLGEGWVVPEMVGLGCELVATLGELTTLIR